jgi:transcriptional regulator with XRE-family HTH domain
MAPEKVARLASPRVFATYPYQLIISFTMTTKQPVPNMLRFYRKQAGLRQVDVAAKLGFTSYDRISHWEKGLAFPSVTNLFRLSALYKVPAQELYGEFFKSIEETMATHSDSTPPFEYHLNNGSFPLKDKNTPN